MFTPDSEGSRRADVVDVPAGPQAQYLTPGTRSRWPWRMNLVWHQRAKQLSGGMRPPANAPHRALFTRTAHQQACLQVVWPLWPSTAKAITQKSAGRSPASRTATPACSRPARRRRQVGRSVAHLKASSTHAIRRTGRSVTANSRRPNLVSSTCHMHVARCPTRGHWRATSCRGQRTVRVASSQDR